MIQHTPDKICSVITKIVDKYGYDDMDYTDFDDANYQILQHSCHHLILHWCCTPSCGIKMMMTMMMLMMIMIILITIMVLMTTLSGKCHMLWMMWTMCNGGWETGRSRTERTLLKMILKESWLFMFNVYHISCWFDRNDRKLTSVSCVVRRQLSKCRRWGQHQ